MKYCTIIFILAAINFLVNPEKDIGCILFAIGLATMAICDTLKQIIKILSTTNFGNS